MIEEFFWITSSSGEKLEAVLRKPSKLGKFPGIIFVAGLGMNLHEYKNSHDEISLQYIKAGFLTLQFSFVGCGDSEGDYGNMTLERQVEQVKDVFSWLNKREDVDADKIGVHATSFGVTTMMLTDFMNNFKSLVFVSGGYDPKYSIRAALAERGKYNENGDSFLNRRAGGVTKMGKQFWLSVDTFDPFKEAQKIRIPVFMIHGDQDTKVKTADVKKIFSLIPGEIKKLKIFAGGDHGITDVSKKMRNQFLKELISWFKQTL